jgi:hypothetical protein
MKRESHIIGYVWVIRNPENHNQIIYVGQSQQPWFTIRNMMLNPKSPIAEVVNKLRDSVPVGVEILGSIVAYRWDQQQKLKREGALDPGEELIELPEVPPGMARLEWEIVDEPPSPADCALLRSQPSHREALQEGYMGNVYVGFEAMVPKWVAKLRSEGHPLLNKPLGRRPGSTRKAQADHAST